MDREKDMIEANTKGQNGDLARAETRASALAFAERKSEKLATALYLVSDIMTESDPVRRKLREEGVDILSDIGHARASSESDRAPFLRRAMCGIERVTSLLDIARTAKMISEMNAGIVRREYVALREMLEAERIAADRAFPVRTVTLTEKFFAVDAARLPRESVALPEPVRVEDVRATAPSLGEEAIVSREVVAMRPGDMRANDDRADRVVSDTSRTMSDSMKAVPVAQELPRSSIANVMPKVEPRAEAVAQKVVAPIAHPGLRQASAPVVHPAALPAKKEERPSAPDRDHDVSHDRAGKDDRRKIILTLLRHSRDLTVKDIQKGIPGVSEKTVQRELLAMVADGTLQKKGERRWSRYSLKPGASI